MNALTVGRQDVKPLVVHRGETDAEKSRGARNAAADRGITGSEGHGHFRLIEAEVSEGLTILCGVGDGEARFMFEGLQFVDDGAGGVGIGGPLERFGDGPRVAFALEAELAGARGSCDFKRANIGRLGSEHALPGLE